MKFQVRLVSIRKTGFLIYKRNNFYSEMLLKPFKILPVEV